ncbi:MAG: MFS transporter [SAR202 cluster bacterium]|nr:MFS transporter [SAR202 cluster bacterium]
MSRPFFYGWVVVAALFMVNFATMATGTLNFGLFVKPMGDSLEMSRGFIGWSQTTRMLSSGLSSVIIGRMIDRHGPKLLIIISSVVTGISMIAMFYINAPWQFLVLFGVMGLSGLSSPGALLTSTPVAKWFVKKRGRALALTTMGIGMGGIAFMPITQILIDAVGWRGGWVLLAIIGVGITVPLAAFFIRRQPEDMGLRPDGDPPDSERPVGAVASASRQDEYPWTVREATRTRAFWLLIAFFSIFGIAQGLGSVHRLPYWEDKGFDATIVSLAFSADAAGAALMAFGAGLLVDRFQVRYVAFCSCIGFIVAVILMIMAYNTFFLFASTTIFGLAVGANMIVTAYVWAAYFGRAFLGTIRGIVMPAVLISQGIGAPLAGYIYGANNDSYILVWWMLIGLFGMAGLLILNIKAPPRPVESTTVQPQPATP